MIFSRYNLGKKTNAHKALTAYAFAVQDKLERIRFRGSLFTQPCGIKAQGKTGAACHMLPLHSHIGLLKLRVDREDYFTQRSGNFKVNDHLKLSLTFVLVAKTTRSNAKQGSGGPGRIRTCDNTVMSGAF